METYDDIRCISYATYALFPNLKKPQDIKLANIDLGYIFPVSKTQKTHFLNFKQPVYLFVDL